jgi:hypothetical protein
MTVNISETPDGLDRFAADKGTDGNFCGQSRIVRLGMASLGVSSESAGARTVMSILAIIKAARPLSARRGVVRVRYHRRCFVRTQQISRLANITADRVAGATQSPQ